MPEINLNVVRLKLNISLEAKKSISRDKIGG
jgi:hypothetical protein